MLYRKSCYQGTATIHLGFNYLRVGIRIKLNTMRGIQISYAKRGNNMATALNLIDSFDS